MTEHYNIINDRFELEKFFDIIMPDIGDLESYFISLSARNKYLTKEEQAELHLGRTEMFDRQIIRHKNYNKFVSKLKQYECSYGSYLTKTNKDIPQKCIVAYININPTHALKAYKEFNKTMNEYLFELATVSAEERKETNICQRINKMNTLLQNSYQKSRSKKYYIDIDFDISKECIMPKLLNTYLLEKKIESFYWIDTKGGYHLLIPTKYIEFNPQEIVDLAELLYKKWGIKRLNDKWEIVINEHQMIPIPGTLQANYPVRVLWEYSYIK